MDKGAPEINIDINAQNYDFPINEQEEKKFYCTKLYIIYDLGAFLRFNVRFRHIYTFFAPISVALMFVVGAILSVFAALMSVLCPTHLSQVKSFEACRNFSYVQPKNNGGIFHSVLFRKAICSYHRKHLFLFYHSTL